MGVELRLLISGAVVIGPVQAVLLEEIRRTGSISAAGRRMGVSYIYVWKRSQP
jgi:molybdate transport system regulatory protein